MMTWKRIARRQCSERRDGRVYGEKEHLGELVSDFFDLFALLADDRPVELLIHNQIFGAFVFLSMGVQSFETSTFQINNDTPQRALTILWTISMSSRRASWTPLGSPSIRTRLLRSESWGIRTDTLYCSLMRLTEARGKKSTSRRFL